MAWAPPLARPFLPTFGFSSSRMVNTSFEAAPDFFSWKSVIYFVGILKQSQV